MQQTPKEIEMWEARLAALIPNYGLLPVEALVNALAKLGYNREEIATELDRLSRDMAMRASQMRPRVPTPEKEALQQRN